MELYLGYGHGPVIAADDGMVDYVLWELESGDPVHHLVAESHCGRYAYGSGEELVVHVAGVDELWRDYYCGCSTGGIMGGYLIVMLDIGDLLCGVGFAMSG